MRKDLVVEAIKEEEEEVHGYIALVFHRML
jgi:hypothetical protein